jgi:hypothetical protein
MITQATLQKRQELLDFIKKELAPDPAVQAVIGIGSIASGLARPDSDIDAIVFLDPYDAYIIPAEFIWLPSDRSFHSIFSDEPDLESGIQFDIYRCDLKQWMDPSFEWPEANRFGLSMGWPAFDRNGKVAELIARRTTYTDVTRISRLDDAITEIDQILSGDGPQVRWESLGPLTAHDRLQAAYGYLVQALFAYNRCWRTWREREMSALLTLPWLPEDFANRVSEALFVPSMDFGGYMHRVEVLRGLFQELIARLVMEGFYGDDPIGESFIRGHEEPGRAWNMDEWNRIHAGRGKNDAEVAQ